MKKIITMLLVVVMVAAMFATVALATEPTDAEKADGFAWKLANLIDKLNDKKGPATDIAKAIAEKKAAEDAQDKAIVAASFDLAEKLANFFDFKGFARLFDQVNWMVKNIFAAIKVN